MSLEPDKANKDVVHMYHDGAFFRTVGENCYNLEVRIKEMDEAEIKTHVLSTVPIFFQYNQTPEATLASSMLLNNHISEACRKYPDRFLGLCTLPMQSPELAISEMKRTKAMGLVGVEIGTTINDWNLDAPELESFWSACESLDMPVFVHPLGYNWVSENKSRWEKYWSSWLVGMPTETSLAISSVLLSGLLNRHPNLRLCFAHGGGSFPLQLGRIMHGYQCRPDLVATDSDGIDPLEALSRGQIWFDSLIHDEDAMEFVLKKIGKRRMCLGR